MAERSIPFHIFQTHEALSSSLAEAIVIRSQEAIEDHGSFSIAFSGGSLPKVYFDRYPAKRLFFISMQPSFHVLLDLCSFLLPLCLDPM